MCGAIHGWYPFELVALSLIILVVGTLSLGCVSLLSFTSYTIVQQVRMTATAQAEQTATSREGTAIAYQQATATIETQLQQTATAVAIATAEAQATLTAEFQAKQTAEAEATMTAEFQAQQTSTAEARITATSQKQVEQTATAEAQTTATAQKQVEQTATAEAQTTATAQAEATAIVRSKGIVIEVSADKSWQDSGMAFESDEIVIVTYLSGQWKHDAEAKSKSFDASGNPNISKNWGDNIIKDCPHAALIGRINNKIVCIKTYFKGKIGELGHIELRINDVAIRDNNGKIKVLIQSGNVQ